MSVLTEVTPVENRPATTASTDLIRLAVERNADIDKLEKLIALQTQMNAAAAAQAYNAAFSAFKAEAVTIFKNKSVTAGPLSGKKYAELYAVVNAVTPALSKHGLSASWKITKDEKDWIEVTCMLKHVGGHVEVVSMGGPPDAGGAKNPIQARASTVTYLERYTLKAILGVSEEEDDDDGNWDPVTSLSSRAQSEVRAVAAATIQAFNEGNDWGAYEEASGLWNKYKEGEKRNQIKLALAHIFKPHSALRASLKASADKERDGNKS